MMDEVLQKLFDNRMRNHEKSLASRERIRSASKHESKSERRARKKELAEAKRVRHNKNQS